LGSERFFTTVETQSQDSERYRRAKARVDAL